MENKAEYQGECVVKCQSCGRMIGMYRNDIDNIVLEIGIVQLISAHGHCDCGAEWHWTRSEKQLEVLLERVLKLRATKL